MIAFSDNEFYESVNSIVLRSDKDCIILYINDFGLHFFGYTAQELVGQHVLILLPKVEDGTGRDTTSFVQDLYNEPKKYSSVTNENITKDGRSVWVTWTNKVILDEQGEFQELLAIGNDVTSLKATEVQLRKSEERFRLMNRAMVQAVALHEIICDDSGTPVNYRFLDVNPSFEELLGKSITEIVGKTVLEILPGTEPYWIRNYGEVALSGQPIYFEEYAQTLDRYFDVVAYSPQPGQFAVIASDVTKKKKAEDLLRKSEERYRLLSENAKDMIYRMSLPDGKYEYVSPAALELFGYSPSEFYTTPALIAKVIHPDWENYFEEQWARLIAGDMSLFYEYQIVHKFGEVKWIHQRNVLVKDNDGKPIAIEAIATDITDQKKAENEREALIANLQDKTAEQERFIYTVSHDLKSPLITIGGFCDLAKMGYVSGDQELINNSLDIISNAADRMNQLLNELLHLSRVGVKINPSEIVNLEGLIKEASKSVSGVISENNTTLEIEPGLPDVKIDRKYFLQVFENLLTNASRYSRSANGGSHVKIGVTRNANELVCYVKDNGIGIETEYLEKVFGLFEKLDAESGNTGVGLAIVKRIIETHGGRIWAESEGLGHGTTFFFTLPEA